ncbi:cytochrome c oxidase assembly protein [Sphingomonas parva]|uniref:Cytochrome c oxidase assembly protein n=2 Tax=Sphingomonas parva TaxID=2555898 RepID=A0A4Y8ZPL3_9SPHN|nr:cytochrome c oxidase assembly protein [Sphingomonas parva]
MNERIWIPYCGAAPDPGGLIGRWNLDPGLLCLFVAISAIAFVRTAGRPRERALFFAATAVTLLLFVSPFCALTSALFAARSAHHVLLTALAAPLIAAAMPRSALNAIRGGPASWTAVSALILWLWHAPSLYGEALSSNAVYWLMQASLLGSAIAFWATVRASSSVAAVAALLAYMVQMGLLGSLLTFSDEAFYAPHALTTTAWGFSPLEDQQLAGLLMWVPGALAYLCAALARLHRLLEDEVRPNGLPA